MHCQHADLWQGDLESLLQTKETPQHFLSSLFETHSEYQIVQASHQWCSSYHCPVCPAYIHFSSSDSSTGLEMYTVCWMGGSRRSFCTRNWPLARGLPHLHFKDVCKRNMRAMDSERQEDVTNNCSCWRCNLYRGLEWGEEKQRLTMEKPARQKENNIGIKGEHFHMYSL